jgi:DNA polymerase III delta' subunit
MNPIIGNEALMASLFSAIKENRFAGTYLIEGEIGSGKKSIARTAAAALCCQNRAQDHTPCGLCHSCKSIFAGNHIDVIELMPEEEGKRISVEQVRQMLRTMYITPTEGDWRIFIIPEAEKMKKEAQNALLKSIEEPKEKTVFFLLTSDKTRLLPTVRSRAISYRTESLRKEQIEFIFQSQKKPTPISDELFLLSGGSAGKAILLFGDQKILNQRKKVLEYFAAILEGASFTRLSLILPPDTTDRKEFSALFPMIKSALRDLICASFDADSKPEFFTDQKLLGDLASIISTKKASELFDLSDQMIKASDRINLFSELAGFHLKARQITKAGE